MIENTTPVAGKVLFSQNQFEKRYQGLITESAIASLWMPHRASEKLVRE